MDFRDFRQAVAKVASDVAPAYKAGSIAILSYTPYRVAVPFLALAPPLTLLAVGQPNLFLIPEVRKEVGRELAEDVDYTRLGEMAAAAYLTKKGL